MSSQRLTIAGQPPPRAAGAPLCVPLGSAADVAALWPGRKAAFVAGHPGHELAVLGWIAAARPVVHVLTDGSGHFAQGRSDATADLIGALGSRPGALFAALSDAQIYRAFMDGDTRLFCGVRDRLAAALADEGIDLVVGDAREGFNPTHDICRALIDAAVPIVARRLGRPVLNYAVRLTDWETVTRAPHGEDCLHLELSDALYARKLAAAAAYGALKDEVARALTQAGGDRFRTECLIAVDGADAELPGDPPHYEIVGRERVVQGVYDEALLYREHVLPVMRALRAPVA